MIYKIILAVLILFVIVGFAIVGNEIYKNMEATGVFYVVSDKEFWMEWKQDIFNEEELPQMVGKVNK